MYRLTARLLLLLSLLSVCAPAVVAVPVTPQHNCCTRKCCRGKAPHIHESSGPSLQARSCCPQNCLCSQTIPQWADVASPVGEWSIHLSSILQSRQQPLLRAKDRHAAHSVRGPPSFFIA